MKDSRFFIFVLVLLLLWLGGCSERSTPTGPAPNPTPGGGTGTSPIVLTNSNHDEGWGRSECLVCHQPGRIAFHHDLTAEQCLGCHGDNGTQPGYARCVVCHGNPPAVGAHAVHIALHGFGLTCSDCHAGAGLSAPDKHRDGVVQVSIVARYGGAFNGSTCSSVFCHGIGTPNWFADKNLSCDQCHDGLNGSVAIGPRSGKHGVHVGGGIGCAACHSGPPSTHFDGVFENPDHIRPDNGSYHDTTPNGYAASGSSGTCSGMTSPCHAGTAEWTTGSTCGTCHPATNANPPTSGSHTPHASAGRLDYPCSYCHFLFPKNHINGKPDVVFNAGALPGGGSFSGNRCFNVYCHGAGRYPTAGGSNNSPTWGDPSTAVCGCCHGAPGGLNQYPTSGKHRPHLESYGAICSDCHSLWPSEHVDGVRTIIFGPGFSDAVFTRAPIPNEGSCSSILCHMDYPSDNRSWKP